MTLNRFPGRGSLVLLFSSFLVEKLSFNLDLHRWRAAESIPATRQKS